jgi:hypothetical protein
MRDNMVKSGFNTSEADGMSGMGAQYRPLEEREKAPKPVPVQKEPTKPSDASKVVPVKAQATVPVVMGVQVGDKTLFAAQIKLPVPKGTTPENYKKTLTPAKVEELTRQYRDMGKLASAIESGAVSVTLMRKVEVTSPPANQIDLHPRRDFEAYVPVSTDKSDVNAIVRELRSGKGAVAVGHGTG